jgi:hypothetical protein
MAQAQLHQSGDQTQHCHYIGVHFGADYHRTLVCKTMGQDNPPKDSGLG